MYNPISTYRIQFNKEFTLSHFESLFSYFQTLGIHTIYASPIFVATPGSLHGYDGVDPNHINPEIGTEEQVKTIAQRFHQNGMGWIQDIVPNHMAYHSNNVWLTDVLEKGPLSRYALFFETALASSFFHGRMQAPFLPESLDKTIAAGKLTLAHKQGRFVLNVSENTLPLKPGSYATVLQADTRTTNEAVAQLLTEIEQLRHTDEPVAYAIAWEELRLQLTSLAGQATTAEFITRCVQAINDNPDRLRQLADEQHYRFCTEPETRQVMNYRRFFAVNSLICLNMREELVFQHVHELIKKLVNEKVFQGLRVDHVDGLYDPAQYLNRLRALTGENTYIVVEKILQGNEDLPLSWPVQGTSGYDFLALVNNLLTDSQHETTLRNFYHHLIGSNLPLADRIQDRKAYFLAQYMGGEIDNLYHYFLASNLTDDKAVDSLAPGELKQAISQLLVACPVYRYYGNQFPLPDDEAAVIRQLLQTIRKQNPDLQNAVAFLEEALLLKPPVADEAYNQRAGRFYQRLMQFSSPLMAKGVEDTLLYTYNCFIGHNEVGDSPARFGLSANDFHQAMQVRQRDWPLAQNTTATHDTKRGEDVRARLNVLTDLADEWLAEVQQWQRLTSAWKQSSDVNETIPDSTDEYFIYQNLLGAYPMPNQAEANFPERFKNYLEKALQEAKRHTTGWTVDDTYHKGVEKFADKLLDKKGSFWSRFQPFHQKIADFGVVNSLVQVLLKFTCPGVPDIYQGGEGWDLSFVDPDNRRPVDFSTRQQWLTDLTASWPSNESGWTALWQQRFDGRLKFWLTYRLLQERQQNPALFAKGDYIPLVVEGPYRDHILAFARRYESSWRVVVVPLHTAQLCQAQDKNSLTLDWENTQVRLPERAPTRWTNRLDNATGSASQHVQIQPILKSLPVALLQLV